MIQMNDEKYEWWFAGLRTISDKKKRLMRQEIKNAKDIYNIEETRLKSIEFLTEKDKETIQRSIENFELEQEYQAFQKKNIMFIPYFDEKYPERLKQISAPPYALYVKGSLPDENKPTVAIVGARQCTAYGERMSLCFAEAMAEAGVQIISGMARGVDGAAQRGALNVGGTSYGILGSGIDICYPREHIGLYMDLQKAGGILSEQPAGTPPLREYFPARNRIISGLSDVVLVIEAKSKSGSLITADMALEQGKEVYALPGPIDSELSRGCHELIRQGAGILISPEELLEELHLASILKPGEPDFKECKNEKVLETTEVLVYSKLDLYPKSVNQLLEETGLPPDKLMQQIISLMMKGYIKEVSRNYYIKAEI